MPLQDQKNQSNEFAGEILVIQHQDISPVACNVEQKEVVMDKKLPTLEC